MFIWNRKNIIRNTILELRGIPVTNNMSHRHQYSSPYTQFGILEFRNKIHGHATFGNFIKIYRILASGAMWMLMSLQYVDVFAQLMSINQIAKKAEWSRANRRQSNRKRIRRHFPEFSGWLRLWTAPLLTGDGISKNSTDVFGSSRQPTATRQGWNDAFDADNYITNFNYM